MFTNHRDVKQGLQLLPPLTLVHTNRQSHTQQTPHYTHKQAEPHTTDSSPLKFAGFCLMYTRKEEVSMAGFRVFPHKCSQRKTCMDRHIGWPRADRGLIRTHKIPTYLGRTERKISNLELMLLVKYEEFLPEKWEWPEWITRLPYSREIPSTRTLDTLGPKKDMVWETFIVQWERSILWNLGLKNNQQVKLERVWPLIDSWIVQLS